MARRPDAPMAPAADGRDAYPARAPAARRAARPGAGRVARVRPARARRAAGDLARVPRLLGVQHSVPPAPARTPEPRVRGRAARIARPDEPGARGDRKRTRMN